MIIVISGPSSVGKSRTMKELMKINQNYSLVVSHTTRMPRIDEKDGVDYEFISSDEFDKMIENDQFFQWKSSKFGKYGTSYKNLSEILRMKRIPFIDADPDSYVNFKISFDEVIGIFLLPPEISVLCERLMNRGRDRGIKNEDDLYIRLKQSLEMTKYSGIYDYILVNQDDSQTAHSIDRIISVKQLEDKKAMCYEWWMKEYSDFIMNGFNH